jgi:tetratricopeptide (TPR) repeat protein
MMGDDEGPMGGFSAGSRIAGYRLEKQIGQGGMAVVFRARDERLQRQVALKILSPALATDEAFRRRFVRESRSAAAVDDPHIIPVFDAGDADGVLFIAMRYVPGGDVGTLVRQQGPLPVARAAAIVSAVASALDAAHAAGLVHRDVKPANMLVDARPGRPDFVYLSDFGLTKGAVSSASQTETGPFMGTPPFCAPEQIQGEKVDARTDEYALACAAFMLLSGEPPFPRDDRNAVLYAQLSASPPRLTSRRPGLPPSVDDVLLRALAKAPDDRYASCGEFAEALRMAFGLQRYDSDVAVALHQRSLVDQQQRLGLEHADTLAARFSIAQERAARGEHTAAEEEFAEVLAIRQRTLGPEHRDTLATRFSAAQEMAARGDHVRAEEEFRKLLAVRQRTLGRDHPDTLATRFAVAQEMAVRGDHAGAEDEFRRVLPLLRRRLGPDHPDTLATRFSIAREMAAQGDHAEAEDEYRDVLPHVERRLGPDHPITLVLWSSVAREMAARGDHAGAQAQFRDMLPFLQRKLGPDHPDTRAAIEWIDYIQGKKDNPDSRPPPGTEG